MKKKHYLHKQCVCFQMHNKKASAELFISVRNYLFLTSEGAVSHNVSYYRQLPITRYQVSFYADISLSDLQVSFQSL